MLTFPRDHSTGQVDVVTVAGKLRAVRYASRRMNELNGACIGFINNNPCLFLEDWWKELLVWMDSFHSNIRVLFRICLPRVF